MFASVLRRGALLALATAPLAHAAPSDCHVDAASLLRIVIDDAHETMPSGRLAVPVLDGLGRVQVPAGSLLQGTTPQLDAEGRYLFHWVKLILPDQSEARLVPASTDHGLPTYDDQGRLGLASFAPGVRTLSYGAYIHLPGC